MSIKLLVAVLIAALAILPGTLEAAKRPRREKSRSHKVSAKARERKAERLRQERRAADRREFERRWDHEQLEPDLPESE